MRVRGVGFVCECRGDSALWLHRTGVVWGQGHAQEHTGTYTQMLHLPFSDLPLKKCPKGVRVRFRVPFQAVKVPIFGGFPVENPTRKAAASKLFQGGFLRPRVGSEGFRGYG